MTSALKTLDPVTLALFGLIAPKWLELSLGKQEELGRIEGSC
jgi:hypothetical protein